MLRMDHSEPHNDQRWINLQKLYDAHFPSKATRLMIAALQLYSGRQQMGRRPCVRCLVHKSQLNAAPSNKYPVRLELQQVAEYNKFIQPPTPKLEGQFSTVSAASPLWGWRYGDNVYASSTMASVYAAMHVADLGIWVNQISIIQPYLCCTGTPGSVAGKISQLNNRITQLPRRHNFLPY
jgi:hypothetical protein